MVQKYISFSMYEREGKERDGELWERPSTLTSFHGWEKGKKKKIPNYLEVRICPNKKQTWASKSKSYPDLISAIPTGISNNVLP